jgi:glycosyltransferase involved in cell wall biosynthesis
MRISIAMCTYNGEQYLQKQLDSFASQTLQPCELVVCDDGSTDATLELLNGFAGKAAFPVRIFRNERNLGSTKNFEQAIGICQGNLIALSDQDDEWYPDKLAQMHSLFEEFPDALAAFSDADVIDDNSAPTGRKLWKTLFFAPAKNVPHVDEGIVSTLLKLNYIATGATIVFRAELRPRILPIPSSWVHDAWISWIAGLCGGLAPLPAATIRYRLHSRQQIGVAPASLAEHAALAQKNLPYFRKIATRLKALRFYLEQHKDDEQLARFIPDLDAKIRHIEGRASLPPSVLHRVGWILLSWREYHRFARGPIAMLSDAFIVSTKKTPGNAGPVK